MTDTSLTVMGCIRSVWVSTQRRRPDHVGADRSDQEVHRAVLLQPPLRDLRWWSGGGSQGREDRQRDLSGVWAQYRDQPGGVEDVLQAGGEVPHPHTQL